MGRKLYAKGEGFNPSTSIEDVEGLREELDALKENGGGGGGDNAAIERRLRTAEGEIDDLQREVAEQSEEVAAVGVKVNALQGTDAGKSVRTIAAEETAKIVGNAPANYDTLKEIADYITSDATGAAEMSNKVNKNTADIADLDSNKLGKTEKATDSAKLGGVIAGNFVQNNGGLWNIKAQEAVGADKAKVLTVNGITSDTTYGTTAGIIQNTADNPTDFWWNKIRILHNNSAGYFTELAMPFRGTSGLYFRAMENGVQTEWCKIPYASEIPTLALQGKKGLIPRADGTSIPVGWYRIGVTTRTSQQGWTFRMMLRRHSNSNASETYIIDAAIGYASGAASNVYFTQVAGGIYNSKFIDKVRVTVAFNYVSYVDLHISTDCTNNIEYLFDGDAKAYASGTIVTEETATTYEFTTVNGMASSHNITASKVIGVLQGNADSATKLATSRTIWGQSFDGTGDIDGDITVNGKASVGRVRLSSNIHGSLFFGTNAWINDSHELVRIDSHSNVGAAGMVVYGNKSLKFNRIAFVTAPAGSAGDLNSIEKATILELINNGFSCPNGAFRVIRPNVSTSTEGGNPIAASFLVWNTNPYGLIIRCNGNTGAVSLQARREGNETEKYPLLLNPEGGNVGIGTTSPSEKLEVAGNIKASGTVTATATYHSSDERLKTFEGDVEVDLEKLKALPKKYFHWTADADGKRQLGTSAQAVEEVFPELVSTNADGYKSVNYANLSIVALAGIDKLAEQNADLKRRVAKIEKLLNIE